MPRTPRTLPDDEPDRLRSIRETAAAAAAAAFKEALADQGFGADDHLAVLAFAAGWDPLDPRLKDLAAVAREEGRFTWREVALAVDGVDDRAAGNRVQARYT